MLGLEFKNIVKIIYDLYQLQIYIDDYCVTRFFINTLIFIPVKL